MHEADFPEAAKELMELHQCTVRKMELYLSHRQQH